MSDEWTPPDPDEVSRRNAEWQARRTAARTVVEAMLLRWRITRQMTDSVQLLANHLQELGYLAPTLSHEAVVKAADEIILPAMLARVDELVDISVNLHARELTVEELDYIAGFYGTTIGQRLVVLEAELRSSFSFAAEQWTRQAIARAAVENHVALAERGFTIPPERMAPR